MERAAISAEATDMRSSILFFVVTVAALPGQTILEHATVSGPAAVGGTAGAVIGNKLGQALGNLSTKVEAASKNGEAKKDPAVKTVVKQGGIVQEMAPSFSPGGGGASAAAPRRVR